MHRFFEDARANVRLQHNSERSTTHVWAILPHTCFTVNTHIFGSCAGKAWMAIMEQESAKSFQQVTGRKLQATALNAACSL
jgi:hypothetical protein